MKKIMGLVIILVALVLGGYFAMGLITEKRVKHDLQAINKSNGISVKIADYKRGFYTSRATLDWRLHVPERIIPGPSGQSELVPAKDYDLRMPLTIHHGPIIIADKKIKFGVGYASSVVPLPEKYLKDFNEMFKPGSTHPQLNLSIFVNYLANSRVEMTVPAFKLLLKKGGEMEWKGMTSIVKFPQDAAKVKGGITFDGLQLQNDMIKAQVEKADVTYNFHKSVEGLYIGNLGLSLPSIQVNNKTEKLFGLTDFDIQSSSDVNAGLFQSQLVMSVDKIYSAGKEYGPGKITTTIKNLDAVVLARIHQQANSAQGSNLERQQSLLAILPEVPKLLAQGPEFEISELSFVMPQGTIDGTLSLSLPKDEQANPFELFYKIKGKGKLKVPAEVVTFVLNEINKEKVVSQIAVPKAADAAPAAVSAPAVDAAKSEETRADATKPVDAVATNADANAKLALPQAQATPEKSAKDIGEQVASMTKTQLDAMLSSGFLVKDGNYFLINAELDKAHLIVNGKPFNAAMLKF